MHPAKTNLLGDCQGFVLRFPLFSPLFPWAAPAAAAADTPCCYYVLVGAPRDCQMHVFGAEQQFHLDISPREAMDSLPYEQSIY